MTGVDDGTRPAQEERSKEGRESLTSCRQNLFGKAGKEAHSDGEIAAAEATGTNGKDNVQEGEDCGGDDEGKKDKNEYGWVAELRRQIHLTDSKAASNEEKAKIG